MQITRLFLPLILALWGLSTETPAEEKINSLYQLAVTNLDGKPLDLHDYHGKVALVVNVASQCRYTPQYTGLEKLFQDYKERGFVILGFPSNEFGAQEPGTPEEIRTLCYAKYAVTFPLLEKCKTKPGNGQSPVFAFLTRYTQPPEWNFHKYLVGKRGQWIASFTSSVTPEDKNLRKAIESALAKTE